MSICEVDPQYKSIQLRNTVEISKTFQKQKKKNRAILVGIIALSKNGATQKVYVKNNYFSGILLKQLIFNFFFPIGLLIDIWIFWCLIHVNKQTND